LRKTVSIFALLATLSVAVACGGGTSSGDKTKTAQAGNPTSAATQPANTATAGTTINVKAKDFAFALDKASGPAGKFTFVVTNAGPSDHEFVIFKTDLAPDALPLVADKTKVDEDGQGVVHIDEIEDLNVGDTKTLSIDLEPGSYVFICNLPAHYSQGMYIAFKVQ
jgi:uncharacterized cupredoxin-like copper-binding protein